MPELPEVASFRSYFERNALGRKIGFARVTEPRIVRGTTPEKIEREHAGSVFVSIRQHGKYLFAELDTGRWLVLHFGMTGFLEYGLDRKAPPAYTRFLVGFRGGGVLAYVNQRMLGWVGLAASPEEVVAGKRLGPSALDPGLDLAVFRQRLSGRKGEIKPVLMNQAVVAGIGNIYSDEILFQAGIHPRAKVSGLDDERIAAVFHRMKEVLRMAVERDADIGKLPAQFLLPHRRKDAACPACGARWARETVGGRTAYFCPKCQK